MKFLAGVKHWTDLQYLGAVFVITLPIMILAILCGYKLPLWGIALLVNVLAAGYAVFFIEWPDENGFNADSRKGTLKN